jgi:hypothetical protein
MVMNGAVGGLFRNSFLVRPTSNLFRSAADRDSVAIVGGSMAGSDVGESKHWQIVLIVVEFDGSLVLVAEPTRHAVPCPKCGELSQRQHSSYLRRLLDLPWRGHNRAGDNRLR